MSDFARRLRAVPSPGETTQGGGPEDDVHLTLWDHVRELRKRLIYSVYAIVAGIVACAYFSEHIYKWVTQPIMVALGQATTAKCTPPMLCEPASTSFVFTKPTDPLFVYLTVAAYAGIFLASPVILYQVYAFVSPGLYRRERRMIVPFVSFGSILFVAGGLFARYIIMPFAFQVLIGQYVTSWLKPMLDMSECLDLALMMLIAFGIIFELPLVITLLARMGIVSSAFLSKYRRHAIVVNTIIAAVITPTGDPFNLALMAIPLVIFYELGILGARWAERRRAQADAIPAEA